MKWPWVSRVEADRELHMERYDRVCMTDAYEATRAEVKRLTDIIVEMKREGFHPAPPRDELQAVDAELPDPIVMAIAARAAPKSDNERALLRYAQQMMHTDTPDVQAIADAIWRGGDYQEDE